MKQGACTAHLGWDWRCGSWRLQRNKGDGHFSKNATFGSNDNPMCNRKSSRFFSCSPGFARGVGEYYWGCLFLQKGGLGRGLMVIRVRGLKGNIIPFPSSDLHIICPSHSSLTEVFYAYVKM
jgi:hypothetical protein